MRAALALEAAARGVLAADDGREAPQRCRAGRKGTVVGSVEEVPRSGHVLEAVVAKRVDGHEQRSIGGVFA